MELVLETSTGAMVAGRLRGETIHVPGHFDVEAVGAVRQAVVRGVISECDGLVAVAELRTLPMRRWAPAPFIERAFELRHTHAVADAVYVALAEALVAPLLTCDARLARSHGHRAIIETM